MKNVIKHGASCLILAVGLLFAGCTGAGRDSIWARPMTTSELSDTWAGFTGDEIYYVIELHSNGMGVGGYAHANGTAKGFRISSWRYGDHQINLSVEQEDQQGDIIKSLSGRVGWNYMTLRVTGRDWVREVTLRRESNRQRKHDLVRNALREYGRIRGE